MFAPHVLLCFILFVASDLGGFMFSQSNPNWDKLYLYRLGILIRKESLILNTGVVKKKNRINSEEKLFMFYVLLLVFTKLGPI